MQTIRLMHAKLHRVRVTSANVDYIGSITIDQALMEKVGLLPLEEVDVVNLSNGKRWSTYAIPGTPGQGEICPNGGAALLCEAGDILIIYAYEQVERNKILQNGHLARVYIADEQNHCQQFIEQRLTPQGKIIEFASSEMINNSDEVFNFEYPFFHP